VDAVAVAYESGSVIRPCVESLLGDPSIARVIVVNNSPGDASAAVRALPGVVYRESDSNVGYGRAINSARDAIGSRYVALVNPDATQRPGTVSALASFLEEHRRCALVAPRMVTSDGTLYRNSKHDMSLPRVAFEALGWPESLGVTRTRAEHERPHRTSYVIASFVLCRSSALDEVRWFDESIFLFGEDQDLCRRLRSQGWEIWYAPVGEVRHLSGHSWRQLSDRGRRLFREARYRELRNAAGPVDAELYRALVWARDTTHRLAGSGGRG
jgi:GT2 family glycosyltransferase